MQRLRDKQEYPDLRVLQMALGKSFPAFAAFIERLGEPEYRLTPEWRYYNDGKAWLCKITRKSKTVLWLSVWDGFFRTVLYFTEASGAGIKDLHVDRRIIAAYLEHAPSGKLKPVIVDISAADQLADLFCLIRYKFEKM